MGNAPRVAAPPPAAEALLGAHIDAMVRFAELLAEHGVPRGLIGPRELDRLWERHLLNSVALAELVPDGASVIDVGSGAGLPGIPLAIARPDLRITLLEPMARRVQWLGEVLAVLGIEARVLRGRAEEPAVRAELGVADVVTARAVASLGRLCTWCLPLTRSGGRLLAVKGERADEELRAEKDAARRAGGTESTVLHCGVGVLDTPTTVVAVRRGVESRPGDCGRVRRKDR